MGIGLDGKKDLLTTTTFWGNEVLEAWRKVLIDPKNRGLVRVLLLVTDDFHGLSPLVKSLLPNTDYQFCTVHLFRNDYRHLSPEDYARFRDTWREICASSSFDNAQAKLRQLWDRLRPNNPSYVGYAEKRTAHYLAFFKYPRRSGPTCAPPISPKASTTKSKTSAATPAAISTLSARPSSK